MCILTRIPSVMNAGDLKIPIVKHCYVGITLALCYGLNVGVLLTIHI